MENTIFQLLGDAVRNIKLHQIIITGLIIFFIIAANIAISIVQKQLRKRLALEDDDNIKKRHNYATFFRILRVAIVLIGVIVILQMLGVNMSWFAISFSAVAILVGLAMKDFLQDLFAGMTILMDKYFTVGDAVEFDGKDGVVIYFTVRTTKIEFLDDHSVLSVANRNISKIRKLTHLVDIDLPLSYREDIRLVYQTLSAVCERIAEMEGIESCEFKGTQDFVDSAAIYKIRFFCEPKDRPDIRRAVLKLIQEGLEEANIRIPYRQIDIHQFTK